MHALLNVGVMAARKAGDSLIRNLNKLDQLRAKATLKGKNDFVSDADLIAESIIIETKVSTILIMRFWQRRVAHRVNQTINGLLIRLMEQPTFFMGSRSFVFLLD